MREALPMGVAPEHQVQPAYVALFAIRRRSPRASGAAYFCWRVVDEFGGGHRTSGVPLPLARSAGTTYLSAWLASMRATLGRRVQRRRRVSLTRAPVCSLSPSPRML